MKDVKEVFSQVSKTTRVIIISVAAVILALIVLFTVKSCAQKHIVKRPDPVIVSTSTLKEVIKLSKLSTFEMIYNGVADVRNESKPDKTDFYASYESRIRFGFDFSKIDITANDETKEITVTIPELDAPEINVDIQSLEFMFVNKKANTPTVAQRAYSACIDDAENEIKNDKLGTELARSSAEKAVRALLNPIIEQQYPEYTLVVNHGGQS